MKMIKLITSDFGVKISRKNKPVIEKILIQISFFRFKIFLNTNNQKKVSYSSSALGIPIIITLGSGKKIPRYLT